MEVTFKKCGHPRTEDNILRSNEKCRGRILITERCRTCKRLRYANQYKSLKGMPVTFDPSSDVKLERINAYWVKVASPDYWEAVKAIETPRRIAVRQEIAIAARSVQTSV